MLRVQADDPEAFAELLARHRSGVWRQLWMWVGHQDDADDLAQEVFLKVYRYRKTYRPQARFNTWLYHIVRNVARNALRTRRRRPTLPLWIQPTREIADGGGEADHWVGLSARTEEEPSRPLERAEMQVQVQQALGHLQARYRQALILKQFSGCSHAEIAAELCLTAKATKSLLYRARREMRNALKAYMLAE
jgi:RNA polymerase sigma-70 factor (ECF subfamily)